MEREIKQAPRVLLEAKKEAERQASEKTLECRGERSYGGPWDQGHWANRQ